jgi:hypothetical protein
VAVAAARNRDYLGHTAEFDPMNAPFGVTSIAFSVFGSPIFAGRVKYFTHRLVPEL